MTHDEEAVAQERPDEVVYATLCESGIVGTKVGWPFGGSPPLPWFVYKHLKKGEFYADNSNYAKMRRYDVELYQKEPNDEEREAFEDALARIGPYACYESWIPIENSWVTSYSLTYHPDN